MLIDFHTHVFPDKIAYSTISLLEKNSETPANTDGTTDGLIAEMEKSSADLCVTLPVLTKPSQFDSVAKFAETINEKYKTASKRLLSFAGMHPSCSEIKSKMRYLKDIGIKGVKIHPDYQETFIDDEGYYKILSAAKDNDMIVVTHAGEDYGYKNQPVRCTPQMIKKLYSKVPYDKFVLAHYGGHNMWQEVYDEICDLDCYFDTAFTFHEIKEELFKKILDKHGFEKVLFATDCPWRSINEDKKIFLSYQLDSNIKEAIFYKNALKLLKLENDYAI